MTVKHELQNIISGNGSVSNGKIIQSISSYLSGKEKAIPNAEKTKFFKTEETEILKKFISDANFWYPEIIDSKYIGEGAEQKIYEFSDPNFILKLNDRIFYESWNDYFKSLLVHNYFFPHLAYELMGFNLIDSKLHSVVQQRYVKSTEPTDLKNVKDFLLVNGFINKKNNDYYNPELGIILEDLHDENVLTSNGTLQFIDTVFYLTDFFYQE